jgi:hypothetical protein
MRTSHPVGRIRMGIDQLADELVDVLRDACLADVSVLGETVQAWAGGQP